MTTPIAERESRLADAAGPGTHALHSEPLPPYGVFLAGYLAGWALFAVAMKGFGRPWPAQVPGMDLLLLCLATFRLTELVTEEKVARCLRSPFCRLVTVTRPDGTFEEREVPAGRGLRRVTGELILCPWCAGVWIATLLSFAWIAAPQAARAVLLVFAVAAGGMIFQILAKLMDRQRQALPEG